MERADITYFFEDFFKKNTIAFKEGNQHDVRHECRFLHHWALKVPNQHHLCHS
jgi:hypothetical protein